MSPFKNLQLVVYVLLCLICFSIGAQAQDVDTDSVVVPEEWADTYTPGELAAIDRALWAANLTREDLNFRKDYTEGYGCFPIVRDWLAEPMWIAPGMDAMIDVISGFQEEMLHPLAEVEMALETFPEREEAVFTGMIESLYVEARDESPVGDSEDTVDIFDPALFISSQPQLPFSGDELAILREYCPEQMAWHDVFDSTVDEDQREEWDEMLESEPDDYFYALMSRTNIKELTYWYMFKSWHPVGWLDELPESTFPVDEPEITETEFGRIGIGTYGDDIWEGDFAFLVDPGGDDHYINCRIGAAYGTEGNRFGYFADLEGDDVYDCGDVNITLGAAVLGVAAFYDLGQGDDRYIAGSCSLGAAICGVATFYDDGGTDIYEGKVYTQGAAGFGIGVMVDDSVHDAPDVPTDEETPDPIDIGAFDNDRYSAWANAQAFARTLGFAICSNKRGNEIYEAGGVYLHAPLFTDRYQSFSQGFAIGQRDIDYAGGIALIVDYDGNDRYLGDVYNQGVGYWYSAGLVYDVAGNDVYEMTQYGQGSGIHLAVGGLIDVAGNDSYTMHSGLGTGGSHDYAASVLHDRGGNDQYFGNTSCNGGSLTNSAVIFIDRAGNDTYAGRRDNGLNFGRPARGFVSIGILIDLEGEDDYLGIMDNGVLWQHTSIGVGWDIAPPPPELEEDPVMVAEEPEEPVVELPEVISYEGELDQDTFNDLWDIATRWEVGDNRFIVPHARDRLIEFGSDVLPYISAEFDDQRSGLAIRAFDYVLLSLIESDREGVLEILEANLESDEDMRRRVAMAEISSLKTMELENLVAAILDDPDPGMQRRAIGVLGALESHIADERIISNLRNVDDEALVKVSMETLFSLDAAGYTDLRPLLEHPYISVRETLIGKLVGNVENYHQDLRSDLANYDRLSTRTLRSILKIFATAQIFPTESEALTITELLSHDDWGVRADAVMVVNHWWDMIDVGLDTMGDPSAVLLMIQVTEPVKEILEEMLATETDPYVLFVAGDDG